MNWKVINWWACSVCGLIGLKNEATDKAMRAGCTAVPMSDAERRAGNVCLTLQRSQAQAAARKERGT